MALHWTGLSEERDQNLTRGGTQHILYDQSRSPSLIDGLQQ